MPLRLEVERVLTGVELAWPVGDVVLAQTLGVDEGMQRELVLVEPTGVRPLQQLGRALSLGQFVRVQNVFGSWPVQVWVEVQADLITSKRVELHRIDAEGQVATRVARLEGSMQTRLEFVELADGWLFVIVDPLGASAGLPRFAGSSPLPSAPALPQGGPECLAAYEVCGLRAGEQGGFELLAMRCARTPVTVSWSDRRAAPSVRVLPSDGADLACDEHPELRAARATSELSVQDGWLRARCEHCAQVSVSAHQASLDGKIDRAFVVDGQTWLVARGELYRQLDPEIKRRPRYDSNVRPSL